MAKKSLSPEEIRRRLGPEEMKKRMSFYVHEVGDGQKTARSLSLEEIEDAARLIFDGRCSEAQAASFLVALRIKGSSDDERFGLLNVLREYNEPAKFHYPDLMDYSGFYDGRDGELHLSPAIALVSAAAGARVVLTGGNSRNYNTLHRIALQEVLAALGIRQDLSLAALGPVLETVRVGFVNTHRVNRALSRPTLDRIRLDIGLRTPINTVEVSLNPANAPFHIRGMFHPGSKEQMARILNRSGFRRGLMLTGIGGSGEVPTFRKVEGFEILGGRITPFGLDPEKLGFSPGKRADLHSPDAADQARKNLMILEGKAGGTIRDMTVLNAALILYGSEKVGSLQAALDQARSALASARPLELLEAWRKV